MILLAASALPERAEADVPFASMIELCLPFDAARSDSDSIPVPLRS
jgi:hypothetical protein